MKTLGKYEVLDELGAGAMGKVFRGRDRVLQREVAVKTISTEDADAELKQRFYREARSCGRLSHPNIVTVFDLGEQQGTAYIAMEYLDGEDLRRFIDRKVFMPLEGKLQLMAEVCDGLAHAHENRIVHRDIKPSNIFLLKTGRPKLLDFGIARVWASQLTRVGNALGTPEYMAPEQIRGKETDARSDIFSAAVVFFELLTYVHPFGDTDIPRRVIQEPPLSLRSQNPLIPEKLEQILSKALAKEPAERFQTATEFAKSLRKLSFEVISQCDRMITQALENRQRISDCQGAIADMSETGWAKTKLRQSGVDASIVNKIHPDSARATNASFHYFSLCALSKDFASVAEVFSAVAREHERIKTDIQNARSLVADAKVAEASALLDSLQSKAAEYPEIAEIRRQMQTMTVVPRAPVREADEVSPEVVATRDRIAALFDEDLDKCLAEIEILSPAIAADPVVESYWVRAIEARSKTVPMAKATAPLDEPPEDATIVSGKPDPAPPVDTVPINPKLPAASKPLLIGTAAAVLLVIISVTLFNSGGQKPDNKPAVVPSQPAVPGATPDRPQSPQPAASSNAAVPEVEPAEASRKESTKTRDFTGELAAATKAFEQGEYVTAIAVCDRILHVQPKHSQASALKKRAIEAKKLEDALLKRR